MKAGGKAPSSSTGIPFDEMMAFGLGVLRLSPDAFWAMSLAELRAAIRGHRGEAGAPDPLDRACLTNLMNLFPDPTGD